MVVALTTAKVGSGAASSSVQVVSSLELEAPTTVTLSSGNSEMTGSTKNGADLMLDFATGETLTINDFFILGEDGGVSQLISPEGELIFTGLLGPEPELVPNYGLNIPMAPPRTTQPADDIASDDSTVTAETVIVSEATTSGGFGSGIGASGITLDFLAASGLSIGSAILFLDDSDDENAEINQATENTLFNVPAPDEQATDIEDLFLSESNMDIEIPQEEDENRSEVHTEPTPENVPEREFVPPEDAELALPANDSFNISELFGLLGGDE